MIPNPATEIVEVRIFSDSETEFALYFYTLEGSLAKNPFLLTLTDTNDIRTTIDIKDLGPGIYTLMLGWRINTIVKQLTIIR